PESEDGLLDLLDAREATLRRRQVFDATLYVELSDRGGYRKAGFISMPALYSGGLRLGSGEARRRRVLATELGRFTTMTGGRRDPVLPATEAAAAAGLVGRENVLVIAEVMDKIPAAASVEDRATAEVALAEAAATLGPDGVAMVGHRILAWLDPDGALSEDTDRQRRRGFSVQPQDRQLMSKIRARLTPAARARLEVMLTQWAALGMNNPDDPESPRGAADQPGLDPAALAAAAERDTRTPSQRNHDGLLALMEWERAQTGVAPGGSLASELVITVSDTDLARHAGVAVTATGTRLPVGDLVNLAGTITPWMEVFAGATSQVLYLGRGRRIASRAQRLALFGRDRGCTAPGCAVPFVRTQAHHMPDWADGGCTDIDRLGGACGKHNRWNGTQPGQWESTVLTTGPNTGRIGWRPVGRDGPWLVNPIFHPDKIATGHHGAGLTTRMSDVSDTDPPGESAPPQWESGVETILEQHLTA
ncbi:MAG: DUF222 domain-containing protein, partial [Gordonia sp. (in: high G+C Gram-positive bacteria)]|uniref:HNH endonuclease signature motif containing protein n=1 Tax=Gordonia sp. (in: high G+C Gram-positive bacteria) TaxID=84139 RepID=UPI003BB52C14